MTRPAPLAHPHGGLWQAIADCRRRLDLSPDSIEVRLELAQLMCRAGARGKALDLIRAARSIAPTDVQARFAEASMLIELLRLDEACLALRALLDDHPGHQQALSALLYLLNLLPEQSSESIEKEHRERCASRHGPATVSQPAAAPRRPDAPLRVGLLSADLREHPVGRFVETLASHVDRTRISLHAFHNWSAPDQLTLRLQSLMSSFEQVDTDSDDALEERLRNAGLDVLIDLSGHTLGHRLAVLARKPCPLQLSWLGYPSSTGLSAIDGRILDPVLLAGKVSSSEQAIVLPGHFACFGIPPDAPEPAPDTTRENVVFGSLHRLEKINRQVIESWAYILRQAPQARLLIARDQIDPARAAELAQRFGALGVAAAQLQLQRLDDAPYWQLFNQIDVLLDSFPWSGHTLACEALWMGVPVLTLFGQTVAGRLVSSVLHAIDHPEWISSDREEYCRKALALVAQGPRDQVRRRQLRAETGASRLMDATAFARDFSDALLSRCGRS